MEKVHGKSILKGIAIGNILFYQKGEQSVKRSRVEDIQAELKRYEEAKEKAVEQLNALYQKALKEVGEMNAAVFEVHTMMINDGDYVDSITNIIETQQVNAEYAVATTGDNFAKSGRCERYIGKDCQYPVRKRDRRRNRRGTGDRCG